MKTAPFFVLCCALLVMGCTHDQLPTTRPELPSRTYIDLNQDTSDDFYIGYTGYSVLGVGSGGKGFSGDGITGGIHSIGQNRVLYKRDNQQLPLMLFNQRGDTIRKITASPFEWNDMEANIIHKTQSEDHLWPNTWSLSPRNPSYPYYVGLRIRKDNDLLVGWVKIDVDQSTGVIYLVDQAITSENFIVIDR